MRHRVVFAVALLSSIVSPRLARAQEQAMPDPSVRITTKGLPSTVAKLPIVRDVASAEREGAAFPRGGGILDAARAKSDSSRGTPGGDARTCNRYVASPTSRYATGPLAIGLTRSGDFEIGGELQLVAGLPGKVWWGPRHDPSYGGKGLLVRAARIDPAATPADTARTVVLGYGWPMLPRGAAQGPVAAFFPSGFGLPSAGQWVVVATVGDDWGCFIMDVVAG